MISSEDMENHYIIPINETTDLSTIFLENPPHNEMLNELVKEIARTEATTLDSESYPLDVKPNILSTEPSKTTKDQHLNPVEASIPVEKSSNETHDNLNHKEPQAEPPSKLKKSLNPKEIALSPPDFQSKKPVEIDGKAIFV